MKGATWGFGTETAAHAVRLLLGGHFDRFPTADPRTMGEALPALLWRTQNMFDVNRFGKKIDKPLPDTSRTTSGSPPAAVSPTTP
jgi:hypothetical protein